MLIRFLQPRASSQLWLALTGLLLLLLVSLAWRFHGLTPRAKASEEAPAHRSGNLEGERRKTGAEALRKTGERVTTGERVSIVNWNDSDRDGIPDAAELVSDGDRENFRRWFTAIAEMQFYRISDEWNAEQRDCAGLVRFAWREALRRHDRRWFQRMGQEYEPFAPDVNAYALESNPLGEKLFRTRPGAFKGREALSDEFSEFADARSLKEFNSTFVSRDRKLAQPGDLIFFFQPWAQRLPYHAMIFLGEARTANESARDWVVYHTGASGADVGEVKKVRLAVLEHHPDKRWRPIESNRNFLGFYRLKILD